MSTVVRVERDPRGRVRAHLRAGQLAPRVLDRGPDTIRVVLVATVALLLAGDDVVVEVDVAPGLHLELVDASGTVAYDMRGGAASWRVEAHVGADATLVWAGLPFVVGGGATVTRRTALTLDAGARVLLRETLVLGRTGESGGDLLVETDVTREGRPLLRETLDLGRGRRHGAAILGGARCLDQLTLLGLRADLDGPAVLQLAEPGTVVRTVTEELHQSSLTELCRCLQKELPGRRDVDTIAKQRLPRLVPLGCHVRGDDAGGEATTGHDPSRRRT